MTKHINIGWATSSHVMIVGPMMKDMPGYSRTVDVVGPTQPYAT